MSFTYVTYAYVVPQLARILNYDPEHIDMAFIL